MIISRLTHFPLKLETRLSSMLFWGTKGPVIVHQLRRGRVGGIFWDHIDIRGNGGRINLNQQSIKETIENWLPIN